MVEVTDDDDVLGIKSRKDIAKAGEVDLVVLPGPPVLAACPNVRVTPWYTDANYDEIAERRRGDTGHEPASRKSLRALAIHSPPRFTAPEQCFVTVLWRLVPVIRLGRDAVTAEFFKK